MLVKGWHIEDGWEVRTVGGSAEMLDVATMMLESGSKTFHMLGCCY